MNNLSQRYLRLCQAYSQLAERYTKLDIDHMTLREKLVPFLMAFKYYKQMSEQLVAEKEALQRELNDLRDRYQLLVSQNGGAPVNEELLNALAEAEEQMGLIEETLKEQETDPDPNLLPIEKQLLEEYTKGSGDFQALLPQSLSHSGITA
ncbi:hypothetical protein NBE99_11780 [Thermosynechococcus sp. HN-54]|uniref:hypothetical protein n=1 Tax=Thermosynechococcus sp. HN-54 TaxID=2933959 RepID=UPI00202CB7BC|nr:hypothetical protein [Thermosynechococcus sp. HN-54]URR35306.1 hypothetical protein NBE99_11780 [Thermosynechococcus sp. HN-54]